MPKPIGMKILGSGRCLGSRLVPNSYFEGLLDTSDAWIRERTGIRERRMAGEGESTATFAVGAAKAALADAGLTARDIDLILVATATPEYPFPSTACCVSRAFDLEHTPAFDISATCSGFIYGLSTAACMLSSKSYQRILLIGAETMTRVVDFEDRTSCILFGDGGAAVVLQSMPDTDGPALLHHRLHADGRGADMLWVPAGGAKLPASHMTINERLHWVKMQGREVFKVAVNTLRGLVDQMLSEAGIKADDLALIIPHQSNIRIIEATRARLGLPESKFYVNIDRYGNTSAASIPIGFDEARHNGLVKSGDLVLLISFGAGFTWASALLRI